MTIDLIQTPSTLFDLANKVAIVTGGGGHLGSAIAKSLAAAGAHVVIAGRNLDALHKTSADIQAAGFLCSCYQIDMRNNQEISDLVGTIEKEHGQLNIIVNNAYGGATGTLDASSTDAYDSAFQIAVTAPAYLLQQSEALLTRSSSPDNMASIINIASMYGWVSPDPNIYGDTGHNSPPYYGAAKGGLLQFTRYAAAHLADSYIRVNAISPGAFPKPVVEEKFPDLWHQLNTKQPLKRIGAPAEIQGAVVFLASNASSYVTGINLPVDGGWTVW